MNNLDKARYAIIEAIKTPDELTSYTCAITLLNETERLFAEELNIIDYGVGFLEESLEDIIEENNQLDTIEELTQELFYDAWRAGTLTNSTNDTKKELCTTYTLEEIIDLSKELGVNQTEKIYIYACEKEFIEEMQVMYGIIQYEIKPRNIELTNRQILIMACLQMLQRYQKEIISENQEIKTAKEIYQQIM